MDQDHSRPEHKNRNQQGTATPIATKLLFKEGETRAILGGVSKSTLRRWITNGLIRAHPHSRHLLFTAEEIQCFAAIREVAK